MSNASLKTLKTNNTDIMQSYSCGRTQYSPLIASVYNSNVSVTN